MITTEFNFFLDLIKKELLRKKGVNWAILSTIAGERPEARTVVLRSLKTIDNEITLRIYTHALSEKVEQIKKNANVQVCWYFHAKKVQMQFSGTAVILEKNISDKIAGSMSEQSRTNYQGVKPGSPYRVENSSDFHFSIIEISVQDCTVLHLRRSEPHLKLISIKNGDWSTERLIP